METHKLDNATWHSLSETHKDFAVEFDGIVTHPDFTGKGYAKQLIKFASDKIFNEQKIPYLHVANNNIGAIKLYEKLGFQTSRPISFWNFIIK